MPTPSPKQKARLPLADQTRCRQPWRSGREHAEVDFAVTAAEARAAVTADGVDFVKMMHGACF